MQLIEVELFDRGVNTAVLRMPGRKFPGIFVQGDTMASIHALLAPLQDAEGLPEEVQEAAERLAGLVQYYEDTLREHGIRRPY